MRDSDKPMSQREAYQRGYAAGYAAAQSGSPREPTRAMLDAGLAYYEGRTGARMVTIGGIWDAMYDAWAQEQTGGKAAPINKPSQPDHAGTAGPPDHQPAATTLAGRPDAGAAQAETDGPAADPADLCAQIKSFLADAPQGMPHEGYRYGELLSFAAAALERLRAERDTLAAIVRAADAMHMSPTMDNINAWLAARAKWEGK